MKRILILEPNTGFAVQLAAKLEALGGFQTTTVGKMREACLVLMQQPQDMAIVPGNSDDGLLRALLALQPGIPLVGTIPTESYELPSEQRARLRMVLNKDNVDQDLPTVLQEVLKLTVSVPKEVPDKLRPRRMDTPATVKSMVDIGGVMKALGDSATTPTVKTAIFAEGPYVLGFRGDLNNDQATMVTAQVHKSWANQPNHTAQMQFFRLPGRIGELMLYARPLPEPYFVVVVSTPSTSISQLRHEADKLAQEIEKRIGGRPFDPDEGDTKAPAPPKLEPVAGNNSFAIVWRSLEPIPDFIHIPIRRALERLGEANACLLKHFDVTEDYVHIVVTCPPGRNSNWAAYHFKVGSDKELQQQFQVRQDFWAEGYHAVASAKPLSAEELNIFLEKGTEASQQDA